MNRSAGVLVLLLVLALAVPGLAAPLFPDVPENHWARDAVAALAAKGLVEGYPDGTFKGDRAATRWEVAMVVARLLARMEQEHATFATRAELDELRKLAEALREELDALGVRVTNLEESVGRLDQRVTEVERITFYGEVSTRVGAQTFYNTGSPAMGGAVPLVNYNSAVGSVAGAGGLVPAPGVAMNPFVFGVLTVTDWASGRPLTNGTTFTTRAILGTRVRLSDDLDAGAEFSAFTSQGDAIVDAYWGESAPYLSNPFTATTVVTGGLAGVQPLNQQPYTRLTLDHFWLRHKPSKTELVLGAFNGDAFDDFVYVPEMNPSSFGPKGLDSYGFKVKGEFPVSEDEDFVLRWEAMGTRLADGNVSPIVPAVSYFSHAEGANVALLFHEERGEARLNFLHAANDAAGGAALAVGLIQAPNFTHNWVNPSGYYINQLGGPNPATAGIGSTSDIRPVPMFAPAGNDGFIGIAGVPNLGGIGPQDITMYGLSVKYLFDHELDPRVLLEWGHSDYKPQKNSSYSVGGDALRIGLGASFMEKSLDVDVYYLSVDPTYDPFVLQWPTIGGISTVMWHTPAFTYYNNLYSLHDTDLYTHNREGFRAEVTWKFGPTGRLMATYGVLDQKRTSLQDVRYSAGALGAGIPNTPVLGYSPGFLDPVFHGFDAATFASNGVNGLANPLEDPRGRTTNWGLRGGYKWLFDEAESNRGVLLSGGAELNNFFRETRMQSLLAGDAGTRAANHNYVNLDFFGWHVGAEYDVTEEFRLHGGYTHVVIAGHLDPLGNLGTYAVATGEARSNVVDIDQRFPDLGFDWGLTEDLTWGLQGKYYFMNDNIPASTIPSPIVPGVNVAYGPQGGAHPFNWEGWQVNSYFDFKF